MAVSIRASSFFESGKSTFLPSRFVQSMKLARSTSYGSVALTKPDFSLNGLYIRGSKNCLFLISISLVGVSFLMALKAADSLGQVSFDILIIPSSLSIT